MSDAVRLQIKVIPSSSKNEVVGWLGDALKIKVQAPPEKGKANKAVIRLLAQRLELPEDAIQIDGGRTSKVKWITISGISGMDLMKKLDVNNT